MANRITALVIDVSDAELVAGFWTQVLGWQITERESDPVGIRIQEAPDSGLALDFFEVPDAANRGKNRLHIDVNPTDRDQAAELERLLALGARPTDVGQGDDVTWHVLADPEGNEFCLLRCRLDP